MSVPLPAATAHTHTQTHKPQSAVRECTCANLCSWYRFVPSRWLRRGRNVFPFSLLAAKMFIVVALGFKAGSRLARPRPSSRLMYSFFAGPYVMMKFCKNLAGPCPAPTYLTTYLPTLLLGN